MGGGCTGGEAGREIWETGRKRESDDEWQMKTVAFCVWEIILVSIERCGEVLSARRNYSGIAAQRPPIFRRPRNPFLEAYIMEFG